MQGPEIVTIILLLKDSTFSRRWVFGSSKYFSQQSRGHARCSLTPFLLDTVHAVNWRNKAARIWKETMLTCGFPGFPSGLLTFPRWRWRMAVHMLLKLCLNNCASLVEIQSHGCRGWRKVEDRCVFSCDTPTLACPWACDWLISGAHNKRCHPSVRQRR